MATAASAPKWAQKTITIPAQSRGCHLITSDVSSFFFFLYGILKEIGQDLSGFKCGLAHFSLHHTSASLTINENYDSDVRADTDIFEQSSSRNPDDMPAHIKSSMIPISDGKLNMGTWQGIWLCEHRDAATPRRVVVTLMGSKIVFNAATTFSSYLLMNAACLVFGE